MLTEVIRSGNSKFNLIVVDITQIMLSCVNFEVEFVRRQTNMVAHSLAQRPNSRVNFHKIEIIHLCIKYLLIYKIH
jgi:hypothetical protein